MKRQLLLLWVGIAVIAALFSTPRENSWVGPVRLDGLQLGMEDQDIEERLGLELPGSLCPAEGPHQHRYSSGTIVSYNDFVAEAIEGSVLEIRQGDRGWRPLIRSGQPLGELKLPSELRLEGVAGTLRRKSYPAEPNLFSYRYHSFGSTISDSFDLDIVLQLEGQERVGRIQLVWQGH